MGLGASLSLKLNVIFALQSFGLFWKSLPIPFLAKRETVTNSQCAAQKTLAGWGFSCVFPSAFALSFPHPCISFWNVWRVCGMRNEMCSFSTNSKVTLIPKALPREGAAYTWGGGHCRPCPSFGCLSPHSSPKSQKEKGWRVPNKQI